MGRRQFDARARSLPTHAIQSPLTRPFRSLGYGQAKRTATPGHPPRDYGNIEQGRASTAGRESKKIQGQIDSMSRRNHAMPGVSLQNPCTTTYKMRCAQGELRHDHGHGAKPQRPTSSPRTRGHHTMPPGAPTATLAQRAAQEKLRNPRVHGAQSPRPWGHHAMSGECLPQPLHYDLLAALRTREASARPWTWSSVPSARASRRA